MVTCKCGSQRNITTHYKQYDHLRRNVLKGGGRLRSSRGYIISLHTFRSSQGYNALHTCLFDTQCLFSVVLFIIFFSFSFSSHQHCSFRFFPCYYRSPTHYSLALMTYTTPRGSINHHGVSSTTTCCHAHSNIQYYIATYYPYYIIKY